MTFQFSGLLLRFVDYDRSVSVPAATLGEALRSLLERYPQLRPVLWDRTGKLSRVHRVVINGELVARPDENAPLSETDRVEFFTAIAGG